MSREKYWKNKYYKLKKVHKQINKYNIVLDDFLDVDISTIKSEEEVTSFNLNNMLRSKGRDDPLNSNPYNYQLDKLDKFTKGKFKGVIKLYRRIYSYSMKSSKFKLLRGLYHILKWLKIPIILFTSSNVIYAIYQKCVNGEFSMDLLFRLIDILFSMF